MPTSEPHCGNFWSAEASVLSKYTSCSTVGLTFLDVSASDDDEVPAQKENHWDVTILFSDALTIARNNRCSGRLHCVCAYFSALAILLKPRESWKRNAPRFLFRLGVMETLRQ